MGIIQSFRGLPINKKLSIIFLILALLVLFSKTLKAQETEHERGRAFIHMELSKSALVKAFKAGDTNKLRAKCTQFTEGVAAGSHQEFNSCDQFIAWIASLEVVACGEGHVVMGRIMEPSGKVAMDYPRDFRKGEKCLRDNNSGLLILSLLCGNPIDNSKILEREKWKADSVKFAEISKLTQPTFTKPVSKDSGRVVSVIPRRDSLILRFPDTLHVKVSGTINTNISSAVAADKKDHTGWWIAGTGVGIAGIWILTKWIIDNNGPTNVNVCIQQGSCSRSGPVNAPNGMRVPFRMPFLRP